MLTKKPEAAVHAIDGISFELQRGEIMALVGESGCGKTTTALTLMGLLEADEGTIRFNGEDVTHLGTRGGAPQATIAALESQSFRREPSFRPALTMKGLRRQVQMVFQDPYEALNPRSTVYETVSEPLDVHGLMGTREETPGASSPRAGSRRAQPGRGLPVAPAARTVRRPTAARRDRRRARSSSRSC